MVLMLLLIAMYVKGQKNIDTVMRLNQVEIVDSSVIRIPQLKNMEKVDMENSSVSDVGEALRSLPNVHGIRKGGTNIDPVVRGYKFDQINVVLNGGIKIEGGCPNRMDPTSSHVNFYDIRNIRVIKGPFGLTYGPVLGGVVNMQTIKPQPFLQPDIKIYARKKMLWNREGNSNFISFEGGIPKASLYTSIYQSSYGDYFSGNGERMNTTFEKKGFTGALGFFPSPNHRLDFLMMRSLSENVDFPALPMDERSDDSKVWSFSYQGKNINAFVKNFDLLIYYADVTHIMDNKNRPFSDTVVAISQIDAITKGVKSTLAFDINTFDFLVGAEHTSIFKDGTRKKHMILQPQLPIKNEKIWNGAEIYNLGLFAKIAKQMDRFMFSGIARYDYNQAFSEDILVKNPNDVSLFFKEADSTESSFHNISGTFGVDYFLNDDISINLSLGRGVRSPNMLERFIILLPVGFDDYDYLGNPDILPENNNEADISLSYIKQNIGLLSITGFYSYVTDYILGEILTPTQQKPLSKDVLGVKRFYNADEAYFKGFEFYYNSLDVLPFNTRLAVAYTDGTIKQNEQYQYNDQNEVIERTIIEDDPLPEIPPMEFKANISDRFLNKKLSVAIDFRYVLAQKRTSLCFYEKETPGFFITGMNAGYFFDDVFSINFGVENLFDELYYEHLNRRIIGSNKPFYEPGRYFYSNFILRL